MLVVGGDEPHVPVAERVDTPACSGRERLSVLAPGLAVELRACDLAATWHRLLLLLVAGWAVALANVDGIERFVVFAHGFMASSTAMRAFNSAISRSAALRASYSSTNRCSATAMRCAHSVSPMVYVVGVSSVARVTVAS